MLRSLEYTFPGGEPRMRLHNASRAILMFWKLPKIRMCWSAITMRVRVAFSMVNFVFPDLPASRPMPLDMCSPFNVCFTSFTSKHSRYKSSSRSNATASWTSNPSKNACTKSADFCNAPSSSVSFVVFSSTFFAFKFMRMSIFIFFVTGSYSAIQFSFRGVNRFDGTFTFLYSAFFPESSATPRGANTGRRGSSGISVSSPVSVFTIASPFPSVCFVTFPMTTAGRDSLAARVAAAVESPPRRGRNVLAVRSDGRG
mmetsp:Transcript_6976/g.25661  ORF Transcript_6976/g.25661 Transcript_6976/m.25661 type:complete len:256 (-) Transcript_6976:116-883(-)